MRRYRLTKRFYLLVAAALLLCLLTSVGLFQLKLRAGAARLAARTAERDALVAEIGALERRIDFAQTDAYVERAARDELGLILPGEIRYVSN